MMRRFLTVLMTVAVFVSSASVATAQQKQKLFLFKKFNKKTTQTVQPAQPAQPKPKYWTKNFNTNLSFGQTSLTSWAAGGDNTVTLSAIVTGNANYAKNTLYWNNNIQMNYGFLYASSKPIIQKNQDRIYMQSLCGWRIVKAKNMAWTLRWDFTSQFTQGWQYLTPAVPEHHAGKLLDEIPHKELVGLWRDARNPVSSLLSPAYTNLAVGIQVAPTPWLALNIAPVSGSIVISEDIRFRRNYGMELKQPYKDNLATLPQEEQDAYNAAIASNDPLQFGNYYRPARFQFGAQLTADFKLRINNNFNYASQLRLFSNYLDRPLNLRVNWDNTISWQLHKYFAFTFVSNLIYDDLVMIKDEKDIEQYPNGRQRIQFKETISFGFTWAIAK